VTRALVALACVLGVATAACESQRPAESTSTPEIASLHQRKCASCHRLVEPSTRSRAAIEDAMSRHGKRVRLSQNEWRALVEYLAPSPATSAPGAAHVSVTESWPTRARPD